MSEGLSPLWLPLQPSCLPLNRPFCWFICPDSISRSSLVGSVWALHLCLHCCQPNWLHVFLVVVHVQSSAHQSLSLGCFLLVASQSFYLTVLKPIYLGKLELLNCECSFSSTLLVFCSLLSADGLILALAVDLHLNARRVHVAPVSRCLHDRNADSKEANC